MSAHWWQANFSAAWNSVQGVFGQMVEIASDQWQMMFVDANPAEVTQSVPICGVSEAIAVYYLRPEHVSIIQMIHTWILTTRLIEWSYTVLPPFDPTPYLPTSMEHIQAIGSLFDRADFFLLVPCLLVIWLVSRIFRFFRQWLYDMIVTRWRMKRQMKKFMARFPIIKSMEGYDSDLFAIQKNPRKNPSVLSEYYSDYHRPMRVSIEDARKLVDTIYPIPAKYRRCLAGGDLIFHQSQYYSFSPDAPRPPEFRLYSPISLGLNRNASPRSVFNLVITGQLEMSPPSVNSPCTFTLTNPTSETKDWSMPQGTVFASLDDSRMSIKTTENISGSLSSGESTTVSAPFAGMETGLRWYCRNCGDVAAYNDHNCRCTGYQSYPNGNGICSHDNGTILPSAGSYGMSPWVELHALISRDGPIITAAPPEPKSVIDPGCHMLDSVFATKKITDLLPCCRPISPMIDIAERGKYEMYDSRHAGLLAKFEDGQHMLIEKFNEGGQGLIHGEVVNPPGKDGKFKAEDGKVYSFDEGLPLQKPRDAHGKFVTITGEELMHSVMAHNEEYDLCNSNCQHFTTDVRRDFRIPAPEVPTGKIFLFKAIVDIAEALLGAFTENNREYYKKYGVLPFGVGF
jgi:hypothetical protein